MFINLFGTTGEIPVILPNDLVAMFKMIGNAITQQHSMLALRILCRACGIDDKPIMSRVLESWNHRISPSEWIVLSNKDILIIATAEHVNRLINEHLIPDHSGSCIRCAIPSTDCIVNCGNITVREFVSCIGIESPSQQEIVATADGNHVRWSTKISELCGKRFILWKHDNFLWECRFEMIQQQRNQAVEILDSPDEISDDVLLQSVIECEKKLKYRAIRIPRS